MEKIEEKNLAEEEILEQEIVEDNEPNEEVVYASDFLWNAGIGVACVFSSFAGIKLGYQLGFAENIGITATTLFSLWTGAVYCDKAINPDKYQEENKKDEFTITNIEKDNSKKVNDIKKYGLNTLKTIAATGLVATSALGVFNMCAAFDSLYDMGLNFIPLVINCTIPLYTGDRIRRSMKNSDEVDYGNDSSKKVNYEKEKVLKYR